MTPNYVQAQVLAAEGEEATDIAVGNTDNDANPVGNQGAHIRECIIQRLLEVWSSGTLCKRLSYPRPSADQSLG